MHSLAHASSRTLAKATSIRSTSTGLYLWTRKHYHSSRGKPSYTPSSVNFKNAAKGSLSSGHRPQPPEVGPPKPTSPEDGKAVDTSGSSHVLRNDHLNEVNSALAKRDEFAGNLPVRAVRRRLAVEKSDSKSPTITTYGTRKFKKKAKEVADKEHSLQDTPGKRRRKKEDKFKSSKEAHRVTLGDKGGGTGDWASENWKDSWGEDPLQELAPFPETKLEDELPPSHLSDRLPSYTRRMEGLIEQDDLLSLEELEPPGGNVPIASLAHGLDRVLFNPGVHWMQDPRSRVYNFPPMLQIIPQVKDFDFNRLTPFIKSSRDNTLSSLAAAEGKRFAGSTSSLTGLLSHIYFLISQDRPVDTSNLSKEFCSKKPSFTPGQRMPVAVIFNRRDNVYLIDSDNTDDDDSQWNVLSWMGTMLEKFLTRPKEEFVKLLRSTELEEQLKGKEAYRYSKSNSFIMRSQLDCHDPRLPGSGVFDIKTRAALPIRMDKLNFQENSGYLIKHLQGKLESFEREYYDLIRSAFLKYSFQARIGNMDGIFLAYHNTARIFGYQYIPLEEMDERLFGKKDGGWRVFDKCIRLLEIVADEIVSCFPGKSVACLAETLEGSRIMRVWIQPVEDSVAEQDISDDTFIDERPIIQLEVRTDSYLGGSRVSGHTAVNATKEPWTLHWTISHSSLSSKGIWSAFEKAKGRKFRHHLYPNGIDKDSIEPFLRDLGFGEIQQIPDASKFIVADPRIQLLREVARIGQIETERTEEAERHKPKVLWKQPKYTQEDLEPIAGPSNSKHVEETPSAEVKEVPAGAAERPVI